jgi:hypothetical protein
MPDSAEFTATVNEAKALDAGFAAVLAKGNTWFPQLSPAKQAEVVKYAVLPRFPCFPAPLPLQR